MKIDFKTIIVLVVAFLLSIIYYFQDNSVVSYGIDNVPEYNGESYVIINGNEPEFLDSAKTSESFELYSKLDDLGRCGVAYANIGKDLMPTSTRESIYEIKPSGWQKSRYDFIEGQSLYNRCHLIAFQLTGENANPENLITCTRQMNAGVMLEYENKVGNYIRKTGNHVLYRVTPIFKGDNLIVSGVQMEGFSVEDNGVGIKFNIYVYNVQDNIKIDYKTGKNELMK